MSTDGIGDSFSGGDGFDDLNSSMTGDLFESIEKSFLTMDLSSLASSEKESALVVSRFVKAFKRVSAIGFAILGITTIFHYLLLIYLTPSVYSDYVFVGLLFLPTYLYAFRVMFGLFKNRSIFGYLKRKTKALISFLACSLVLATILGAYPIGRDYLHYLLDSPGTCLMLLDSDETTTYLDNVSCFSSKAFLVIDHNSEAGAECLNSDFGIFDTWAGDFCLSEKRPPTKVEKRILGW